MPVALASNNAKQKSRTEHEISPLRTSARDRGKRAWR